MKLIRSLGRFGLVLCAVGAACEPNEWERDPAKLGLGETSVALRSLETGRQVYATYCAGCHGEKGDGNGPAARFLDPKPRDFRLGRLKFAAVAAGEAPNDEDYLRVIKHGLSGTAMPSFDLLSEKERVSVVAYVKTFYDGWKGDPPGGALSVGKDPWSDDHAAGITEGRKAYNGLAKCWSCHPAYETRADISAISAAADLPAPDFRANLYESEVKDSQWGAPIRAPDFLTDRIKNGIEIETLVRVISTGVGGTAMPTWSGALEPEQLWGLAYYVRSIALQRGTAEAKALRTKLFEQP
jgi:mono/diheme cytochrome c family protein